jgi:hypothetical protein
MLRPIPPPRRWLALVSTIGRNLFYLNNRTVEFNLSGLARIHATLYGNRPDERPA